MSNNENKLSDYIDSLNAEKKPKEHGQEDISPELEELMKTVRQVKSLKEPAMPDSGFGRRVAQAAAKNKKSRKSWFVGFAAVAAAVMIFALSFTIAGRNNIVYAMEQAFQEVKAYHGYIEIIQTNAAGDEAVQGKREVWADKSGSYYVKEVEGTQEGLVTINNGQSKWQIQPDSKEVHVFSAFPDPYRFTFELGEEVEDVKNAVETKKIGEEQVAGREAVVLEVSPQGGEKYKLWIDKETKLPLKKQSAMQNALQYTITYTHIDFESAIPAELIAYKLPEGFKEVNTNKEQLVNNLEEAKSVAGYSVKAPAEIPEGYLLDSIAVELDAKIVKFYYTDTDKQNTVVVLQGKAAGEFKPSTKAVLGKINDSIAELQSPIAADSEILSGGGLYAGVTDISSIRWQEGGFEYAVVGNTAMDDLGLFVKEIAGAEIELPSQADMPAAKPQVEVPVDLEIEKNEQKSVDAGHSPWKLDPVFVAQVFASLKLSPEGITGDYPIAYESLEVEQNTGVEAIIKVNDDKSPISKIYLKKLIRQDNTGIWTVVGYDNAQ
ncbi:MAG: hypothetical protein K0R84_795 [Clostridia bacterium]|jgi:outer membrane lipoprotein-sorting protein|nr:hypothetical protein [Clostridia bacterium]